MPEETKSNEAAQPPVAPEQPQPPVATPIDAFLPLETLLIGGTDAILIALAKAQLAKVGSAKWNQEIHCAALTRLVAALMQLPRNDPRMVRLFVILSSHGAGANSSQFQGWLAEPEQALLPAKEGKAKATAASLLA